MKEMKTRFAKSRRGADAIYDESVEYLTDQVNTAALPGNSEKIPFVVWNTSGNAKKQVIAKELHLFRDYNLFVWDGYEAAEAVEMPNLVLCDANGNAVRQKSKMQEFPSDMICRMTGSVSHIWQRRCW